MEFFGLIERALEEAVPGAGRPALRHCQQGDDVGLGVGAGVALAAGDFGDDRKNLQRHVAIDKAGQVDMAAAGALQRVAGPEQRVGMKIDHLQPFVMTGSLLRHFERADIDQTVDLAFEDTGQYGQEENDGDDESRAEPEQNAFHDVSLASRCFAGILACGGCRGQIFRIKSQACDGDCRAVAAGRCRG